MRKQILECENKFNIPQKLTNEMENLLYKTIFFCKTPEHDKKIISDNL
jgi:type I site-specific restriction endonuclease